MAVPYLLLIRRLYLIYFFLMLSVLYDLNTTVLADYTVVDIGVLIRYIRLISVLSFLFILWDVYLPTERSDPLTTSNSTHEHSICIGPGRFYF
jgi:hypothetical protein